MGTDFELAAKNNILLLHNLKHCLLRFFMGEKKRIIPGEEDFRQAY